MNKQNINENNVENKLEVFKKEACAELHDLARKLFDIESRLLNDGQFQLAELYAVQRLSLFKIIDIIHKSKDEYFHDDFYFYGYHLENLLEFYKSKRIDKFVVLVGAAIEAFNNAESILTKGDFI